MGRRRPKTDRTTLKFRPLPKIGYRQLKDLHAQHHDCLRRRFQGDTMTQIANDTGLSESTVSDVCRGELGSRYLEELEQAASDGVVDVEKMIRGLQEEAVKVHRMIIQGGIDEKSRRLIPDTRLRIMQASADSLLDRGGHGKQTKVHSTHDHSYRVRVGLDALKARGKELGIIDVQPVEDRREVDHAMVEAMPGS